MRKPGPERPQLGERRCRSRSPRTACSRMPRWKLRPPRSSGWKSPAPSKVRRVFVEGARSAAPPEQPGHVLGDGVEDLAGRVAARDALRVGRERRDVRVPALGKLAPLHPLDLVGEVGMRRAVVLERRLPRLARLAPALPDALGEVLVDAVRHEERRVLGPADRSAWPPSRPPARAARRAPWACPRPACRSRCGCGPGSASGVRARP